MPRGGQKHPLTPRPAEPHHLQELRVDATDVRPEGRVDLEDPRDP
jgi:hypothetical protein